MRTSVLLIIFSAILFLTSCADKPARPGSLLTEAQKTAADAAANAAASAGIQGAPAGAVGLPHYYCANNCEGSGGDAQANCPTCGEAYIHNAAFHNQAPTTTPTTTPITTTPTVIGADGALTPPIGATPPPAPSPAQNAKGVYHYTCSAGCAGGAAGAGNCASCGGALAHNAEYHN